MQYETDADCSNVNKACNRKAPEVLHSKQKWQKIRFFYEIVQNDYNTDQFLTGKVLRTVFMKVEKKFYK